MRKLQRIVIPLALVFALCANPWIRKVNGQGRADSLEKALLRLPEKAALREVLQLDRDRKLPGALLVRFAAKMEVHISEFAPGEERGAAWVFVGKSAQTQGQYEASNVLMANALEQFKIGARSIQIIDCYLLIGANHYYLNQLESAEANFKKALSQSKIVADRQAESAILKNIGVLQIEQRKWKEAEQNLREAMAVEDELGNLKDVAGSRVNLGLLAYRQEDFSGSLVHYNEALTLYRQLEELGLEARTQLNLGISYFKLGDFETALIHLYEAVPLLRNDSSELLTLAEVYSTIANVFNRMGKPEDALENQEKALTIFQELGNKSELPHLMNNMANSYRDMGKTATAIKYYNKGLALSREMGRNFSEMLSLDNLGETYEQEGDYQLAEQHYLMALAISDSLGLRENIAITGNELARLYQKTQKLDRAFMYLDRARDSALAGNHQRELMKNHGIRALLLADEQDYQNSMVYLRKSVALKDSLTELEQSKSINELNTRFKVDELKQAVGYLTPLRETLQEKLDTVKEENRSLETAFYSASIIAFLLLIIASMAFWRYREKRRSNQLLLQKNAQIEALIKQQATINRELVHRSINHLSVLQSALSSDSRQLGPGPAQQIVRGNASRVRAMAGIIKTLFINNQKEDQPNDLIPMAPYLDQLLTDLISSFGWSREKVNCQVVVNQGLHLSSDKATIIGLLVNESATNSFKHGFFEGMAERPELEVVLNWQSDEAAEGGKRILALEVIDNGRGLPGALSEEKTEGAGEQRPHFGSKLILQLTDQLKGHREQLPGKGPNGRGIGYRFLFPMS